MCGYEPCAKDNAKAQSQVLKARMPKLRAGSFSVSTLVLTCNSHGPIIGVALGPAKAHSSAFFCAAFPKRSREGAENDTSSEVSMRVGRCAGDGYLQPCRIHFLEGSGKPG